jgi:sugar lactone lactonase YvrE
MKSRTSVARIAVKSAAALLVLLLELLAFAKFEYGRGTFYPDIGADNPAGSRKLEKLIRLDYPPGNLAVAPNGHVYFNYHPIARAGRFTEATVFEWADGKITPFPSLEMQKEFQGTFGMTIDRQNRIWFIEPASFDFEHTRLSAFDLTTRQRVEYFEFPGHEAQFAQDLRITDDGQYILLADPGIFRFTAPKLIVYSVRDHSFRTALVDTPCTSPEDWLMQTPAGPHRMLWGLINFAVGLDGIEISADQKWVYLAPMTSSRLCRVPLSSLLDATNSPAGVAAKVEYLGPKPMSDGIAVDKNGKVIIGDVEHGGIMSFDPNSRTITTLARSRDIIWPDGIATGPDNAIYFTDSAVSAYSAPVAAPPEKARLLAHQPFYIYRLKQ